MREHLQPQKNSPVYRQEAANRSYGSGGRGPRPGDCLSCSGEEVLYHIIVRQAIHHVPHSYRQKKWRVEHVFSTRSGFCKL
jgi:hypothetical protein